MYKQPFLLIIRPKQLPGYKGAPIHLNITVAAEDTSQDPRQEDVIALKIKNPPNKTEYRSGEFFEKRGFKGGSNP